MNWFMYVLILVLLDERIFGLHSMVNYVGSGLVFFWAFYVLYMLMNMAWIPLQRPTLRLGGRTEPRLTILDFVLPNGIQICNTGLTTGNRMK